MLHLIIPPDPTPDSPPRWLWLVTLGGAALTLAVIGLGALVLASGAADPPTAGPVVWSDSALTWAGSSPLDLAPGSSLLFSAPTGAALPLDHSFTLSVSARLTTSSDPGATWGIWAASLDGSRIVWAVRGDRYHTIRRCPASASGGSAASSGQNETLPAYLLDCPALVPDWRWTFYPRIAQPGSTNTLTLHREPDGIRLRINQERLGIAALDLTGAWGLWVQGGDSAPARLSWEAAELCVGP